MVDKEGNEDFMLMNECNYMHNIDRLRLHFDKAIKEDLVFTNVTLDE